MITTKYITDKIKIFLNSIYHLDKLNNNIKITNNGFKDINIVLKEVLESEKLYHYLKGNVNIFNFLNNENKIILDEKKENKKINNINLFNFNQRNISTLHKFYNFKNEAELINNFSLIKIYKNIKLSFNQAIINIPKENPIKKIYNHYLKEFILSKEIKNIHQINSKKLNVQEIKDLNNINKCKNKNITSKINIKKFEKKIKNSSNINCHELMKATSPQIQKINIFHKKIVLLSGKKNNDNFNNNFLTDRAIYREKNYINKNKKIVNNSFKNKKNKNIIFKRVSKEILNLPLIKKTRLLSNYKIKIN